MLEIDISQIPKIDNSVGDLDERSRDSDPSVWPMFSYSQSQTWDGCEERWNLAYRQGYHHEKTSFGLSVGSLAHEGLDIYYGNDKDAVALDTWTRDLVSVTTMQELETVSRAAYILNLYQKYAPALDVGVKPIATEVHVVAPFKTKKGRNYWLQGYADALMEYQGTYEVWDHKTTSTGFWSLGQFKMDPQTAIYAGVLMKQGVYVPRYTVLNQLNTYAYKNWKTIESERLFQRIKLEREEVELRNTIRQFSRLVDELIDRYQESRLSMGRHCSGCQFIEICHLSLKGYETEHLLKLNFAKKTPDPVEEVKIDEGRK